jgi:hypothetical protein
MAVKQCMEPVLLLAEDDEERARAQGVKERHDMMHRQEIQVHACLSVPEHMSTCPVLGSWRGVIGVPVKKCSNIDMVELAWCGLLEAAPTDLQAVLEEVSCT